MPVESHVAILEKVRRAVQRTGRVAAKKWMLSRPFTQTTDKRVLLVTIDERIAQSQIYPFHYFWRTLRECYDAEIREVTIEDYVGETNSSPKHATTVCLQSQFDTPHKTLASWMELLKDRNPDARFVYLDWFAPTDLRLAEALDPYISLYVKKHVLKDRTQYEKPTLGDTNLVDHYSRRFGLADEIKHFPIPNGFLDKLHIGPSFATADFMLRRFHGEYPLGGERPIDVHARLAVGGTPWYEHMRSECVAALDAIPDLNVVSRGMVEHITYLNEMRASKICFSPFGYGEVCWRDYEAIMSGAVVLKQDMSHIETNPDIFVPWKTYVPIKWDLSDFEEKVRLLVASPNLREEISENAFAVLHDYANSKKFARQVKPIFA
jgi:hypothetical protein